jgi:hypothetical protein
MKHGVRYVPRAVVAMPARAAPHVACNSIVTGYKSAEASPVGICVTDVAGCRRER